MGNDRQQFNASASDAVIDALTQVNMGHAGADAQRVFKSALRELVILAKVEKTFEVKLDTAAALGVRDELQAIVERVMWKAMQRLTSRHAALELDATQRGGEGDTGDGLVRPADKGDGPLR